MDGLQHEKVLIEYELGELSSCADSNMVAEPVGSAASVLERIQAIEEK